MSLITIDDSAVAFATGVAASEYPQFHTMAEQADAQAGNSKETFGKRRALVEMRRIANATVRRRFAGVYLIVASSRVDDPDSCKRQAN
ncbi:MAG: hypothetical protein ACLTGU_21475 [Escherichia coli]